MKKKIKKHMEVSERDKKKRHGEWRQEEDDDDD